MLFNSIHFLIFFPIVVWLYFSISHKYRWILLLISSYYFYMSWKAEYIVLIIISTLIDYLAAQKIHQSDNIKIKRILLGLSLATNLGLLFTFKYFNFFSDSIRLFLNSIAIPMNPITLQVLLPVGISFYTFQTLSYTIDVYRGKIKPEKHLGIFAVYVSFFPQLVAGPIERAKNLLPQFYKEQKFEYKRVTDGLKLMLWGFFKKIVIADRLSIVVDTIYNNPTAYSSIPLIMGTIFFAFQIFCDFSGYSDIAIGASKVLGFKLMMNFKRPYFSRTISEFWKRWHISLSSWFKDYLYIPLGGNRVSIPRWYLNMFIVFLVSGLWHGANWTFVIWGALHGIYLIIEQITRKHKKRLAKTIGLTKHKYIYRSLDILKTFILVNIGWIFFRANTVSDAFLIIKNIFTNFSLNIYKINLGGIGGLNGIILCVALILFMELVHMTQSRMPILFTLNKLPKWVRWSIYYIIIYLIFFIGKFGKQEFIYFQF